jgi:hypothetical protein
MFEPAENHWVVYTDVVELEERGFRDEREFNHIRRVPIECLR